MATLLNLNCWVLGEESARIFSVEIDPDKNVVELKRAIKEKNTSALAGIDAYSLDVYNVSIPIDEDTNLEAKVKAERLNEKKPMWPLRKLRMTFKDLDKETLHVVIKAPPISEHRYLFLSV
jgi:hypothetical protein